MCYYFSLFLRGWRIRQPTSLALRYSQTLTLLAGPPLSLHPSLPLSRSLSSNAKCVAVHTRVRDYGMFTQTVNKPRTVRFPCGSLKGLDMKLCNFYRRYVLRARAHACADRRLYSNELRHARMLARVCVRERLSMYQPKYRRVSL